MISFPISTQPSPSSDVDNEPRGNDCHNGRSRAATSNNSSVSFETNGAYSKECGSRFGGDVGNCQ